MSSTVLTRARRTTLVACATAVLFLAFTDTSTADSQHRGGAGVAVPSVEPGTESTPQVVAQLGTLDIRFPFEVAWRSAEVRHPRDGRQCLVAKGRDAVGYTQAILTEMDGAFAGRLWDGAGNQWITRGFVGEPVVFRMSTPDAPALCGGGVPVPPEVLVQGPGGANGGSNDEGGIAGSPPQPCIDAETVDILVVYTPCALEEYSWGQDNGPPPDPSVPVAAGLIRLAAEVANVEDTMNQSLDDSLVSTPDHVRHVRVVSLQPLVQEPDCRPGTWVPDPPDPLYDCHQLEDPVAQQPDIWCGEDTTAQEDLARITDPANDQFWIWGGLIEQKRDYHRADLVVFLRVQGLDGVAGIAQLKETNSACQGAQGHCVVEITGVGTMIHEMGHNFGCCHEPGEGGNFNCSMFPYSFGHRFVVPDGTIFPPESKTIMAYATGEGINFWSNPDVLFPPNDPSAQPTGTHQTQYAYWSDNARTIRETFDDVRCYRCADLPPLAPIAGPVTCWGNNSNGQTAVPVGLGNCTQVAAGFRHTVALQSNGTVVAWGAGTTTGSSPNWGQSTVPTVMPEPPYGDGEVVGECSYVAAGLYHSAAIRKRGSSDPLDGTVVCWGAGGVEQASPHYGQSVVPGNVGACSKVSAGHYHTLGLRRDGLVRAWGAGLSGLGPWPHLGQSFVSPALGSCIDIAAGGYHSVAVRGGYSGGVWGGQVVAWGAGTTNTGSYSEYGQSIVPVTLGDCIKVAAGVFHTVALKRDGTVRAWGAGMTNTGIFPNFGQSMTPTIPQTVTSVVAGGGYIGGAGSHTLALTNATTIVAWGAGTTTTGTNPEYGQAIVPAPNDDWVNVSAGGLHSAGVRNPAGFSTCLGDFNADGLRDGLDLTTLLSGWGSASGDCTGDGMTDGSDLTLLLSGWGNCQ